MRIAAVILSLFLTAPLARGAAVEIGKPAPNFRVTTSDGKTLELCDLRGKRVLVFFWATW